MAASVASIREKKELVAGADDSGSQGTMAQGAALPTKVAVAPPREDSFEDSDDAWEEEDPFIAFAHG